MDEIFHISWNIWNSIRPSKVINIVWKKDKDEVVSQNLNPKQVSVCAEFIGTEKRIHRIRVGCERRKEESNHFNSVQL